MDEWHGTNAFIRDGDVLASDGHSGSVDADPLLQGTSEQRRKIEQSALPGALTLGGHVRPGAIDQRTEPRIVAQSGEHGIDGGDP